MSQIPIDLLKQIKQGKKIKLEDLQQENKNFKDHNSKN